MCPAGPSHNWPRSAEHWSHCLIHVSVCIVSNHNIIPEQIPPYEEVHSLFISPQRAAHSLPPTLKLMDTGQRSMMGFVNKDVCCLEQSVETRVQVHSFYFLTKLVVVTTRETFVYCHCSSHWFKKVGLVSRYTQ